MAEAEAALELVRVDRDGAREKCRAVIGAVPGSGSPEASSVAERALALAEVHDDRPAVALDHIGRAVELAREAGSRRREAEARMTALGILGVLGRLAEAEAEAERARSLADDPLARIRVDVQLAVVYRLFDRHHEAVDRLTAALSLLAERPDDFTAAMVYVNRGTVLVELGELRRARADLERAAGLQRSMGHWATHRTTQVHLARLAALEGDIPVALRLFDELKASGDTSPDSLYDLAECFLSARLFDDAGAAARLAVAHCSEDHASLLPPLRLCQARALLGSGRAAEASGLAELAAAGFERADRPGSAGVARAIAIAARSESGEGPGGLAAPAADLLGPLLRQPPTDPVVDGLLIVARVMVEADRPELAAPALERVARLRRSPVLRRRVAAGYAVALAAAAAGRRGAALRMLDRAIREVDQRVAPLAGTELHASLIDITRLLSELGLRLGRQSGGARRLLQWSEWWRSGVFRLVPVVPPDDPEQRRILAELRRLQAPLLDDGPDRAAARQRGRLEQELRHRTHLFPSGAFVPEPPVGAGELLELLDDRVLVEWVVVDGELVAIVAGNGRVRSCDLGTVAALAPVWRFAQRALHRHARVGDGPGDEPTRAALHRASAQLEDLVVGPVARHLGDGEVVLVPTTPLLAAPWAAMPRLIDRAFTVAPTATLWARAQRRADGARPGPLRLYATAGPDLGSAADEVARVSAAYPVSRVVTGAAATTADLIEAAPQADVVHVAAHGTFRSDNPLLSSVRLADGPLTVYDLEQAGPLAPVWVLAACDVGRSSDDAGRQLLGLTAALLRFGAASVVASTVPVGDRPMADVAVALHRRLAAGETPARALASLRREVHDDPAASRVAVSLLSVGAG